MRALLIVGLATAVTFGAQALAQSTGGGTGGGTAGSIGAGRGTTSTTPVPIQPQGPTTGQTNPGVTPSAPGPSRAQTPPGASSPARQPGFASGGGRQPRGEDVPQPDTSSADAIKELDKELDRKLSICRGC